MGKFAICYSVVVAFLMQTACTTTLNDEVSLGDSVKMTCQESYTLSSDKLLVAACQFSNHDFSAKKIEITSVHPQEEGEVKITSPEEIQKHVRERHASHGNIPKVIGSLVSIAGLLAVGQDSQISNGVSAVGAHLLTKAIAAEQVYYSPRHLLGPAFELKHMKFVSRLIALSGRVRDQNRLTIKVCFRQPIETCQNVPIKRSTLPQLEDRMR